MEQFGMAGGLLRRCRSGCAPDRKSTRLNSSDSQITLFPCTTLFRSISNSPTEIDEEFGADVAMLGETFGVEDLLTFIRVYRQRLFYFKVFPTPTAWNNLEFPGGCFVAADQDVL